MKKRIIIGIILGMFTLLIPVSTEVYAGNDGGVGSQIFSSEACNGEASICSGTSSDLTNTLAVVVRTMIFIAGIIAVIMIVVGGIKYVLSSGDSNAVTSAKNTILYALIGLVVAIMAFAIVNFVLNQFLSQPTGGSSQQEGEGGEEGGGGATPAPRPAPIPPGV